MPYSTTPVRLLCDRLADAIGALWRLDVDHAVIPRDNDTTALIFDVVDGPMVGHLEPHPTAGWVADFSPLDGGEALAVTAPTLRGCLHACLQAVLVLSQGPIGYALVG